MFRNHEGYSDPTAGRACANIDRMIRKANAERKTETTQEADVAAKKKRRHPIRHRKNNCKPKIGVMRW